MADDDQAQEKTEQPSAKRLRESREKGQVARSKDLNAALILLFTAGGILLFGQHIARQMLWMMREAFHFNQASIITVNDMMRQIRPLIQASFFAILPLLMIILLVSLMAPLVMGGWIFSTEALQPKFSRLSPLKGFKRMFSLKGLAEMIKALLKFVLLSAVSIVVLKAQIKPLLALADFPLATAIGDGLWLIAWAFLFISSSLLLIAALDVPLQWYEHNKQLKMTKQELVDEYKETEGKPEVKSQIRRAQQEIAKRRMMSEVPKADVVLTNPTHYAVAMSYAQNGNRAPIVVAKGRDLIALQINRIAQAHKIPMLSVPPLARAVYFSTDLNAEIPRGLYVAVAQVLAYIFQLKNKDYYDREPAILRDLPIPADLRRDEENHG